MKQIEATFKEFTQREDIAIILISQNVASMIRSAIDHHTKVRLNGGSMHMGRDTTWTCHASVP